MKCYICKNPNLELILDLGKQPPSDAFLTAKEIGRKEKTYPLKLYLCPQCFLVQLGYAVKPEILFNPDFVYTTGTNNSLRKNFETLVNSLVKKLKPGKNDLAIDIGSNDGTLLKNYLPYGVKVLGIDPAKEAAKLAIKDKVPTIIDFFNEKIAREIRNKYSPASVITSTNTFAHIHDIDSTMRGIKLLLAPKGVFVSESHYLLDMIKKMQYDWIYHEHLRHYSLKPLQKLFVRFGMEIFDAERVELGHGGSIRVYAAKIGAYPVSKNVAKLIKEEEKNGLYKKETFKKFAKDVAKTKKELLKLIGKIKTDGKKIYGIGAPAKGNTLLNYCGLDSKSIDYLTEKSPFKIGKFAPGSHIEVVADEMLYRTQPDYALILSWNLASELMKKIRQNGFKGKFIIPNPKPKIL